MPPRKRRKKLTLDDLEKEARRHGRALVQLKRTIGYFYGTQYESGEGTTLFEIQVAGDLKKLAALIAEELETMAEDD